MRHTYDIHKLFSIATKNFINLPVTSTFDNTAFDETSNLSALTSALASLQCHLSSPTNPDQSVKPSTTTKRTNERGSKGRYSLWRDPHQHEPQSYTINNGKTIRFCKIHKWNPSHCNDKCCKQNNSAPSHPQQTNQTETITIRHGHIAKSNIDPVQAWNIIQSSSTVNSPSSNE